MENIIILYNHTTKYFFQVLFFDGDTLTKTETVPISETGIESGVPENISLVSDELKKVLPEGLKQACFLVNSDKIFKITSVYPIVSQMKISQLYKEEIKNDFPKYKDNYSVVTQKTKTKLENIIYSYFIPQNLKMFIFKLSKHLGIQPKGINTLGEYIFSCASKDISGDFIYSYKDKENELIHSVISINGILTGMFTSRDEKEEYEKLVFAFAEKHHYELEKVNIDKIVTNGLEFESTLIEYEEKEIPFSFSSFRGIVL